MIIDTHAHIGALPPFFDMTTVQVLRSMDKYGVDFTLVSSIEAAEFDHQSNPVPDAEPRPARHPRRGKAGSRQARRSAVAKNQSGAARRGIYPHRQGIPQPDLRLQAPPLPLPDRSRRRKARAGLRTRRGAGAPDCVAYRRLRTGYVRSPLQRRKAPPLDRLRDGAHGPRHRQQGGARPARHAAQPLRRHHVGAGLDDSRSHSPLWQQKNALRPRSIGLT